MEQVYKRLKPAIADLVDEQLPVAAIVSGLLHSAVMGVAAANNTTVIVSSCYHYR